MAPGARELSRPTRGRRPIANPPVLSVSIARAAAASGQSSSRARSASHRTDDGPAFSSRSGTKLGPLELRRCRVRVMGLRHGGDARRRESEVTGAPPTLRLALRARQMSDRRADDEDESRPPWKGARPKVRFPH